MNNLEDLNFFKKKIKKEHFQNLVAVAHADGEIEETEIEFLSEKALEFGISKEEVDSVLARLDQLQFEIPLNNCEREDQLSDIVFMSMIDGDVAEKEYGLCLRIAEKLDFRKSDLDKVISLVRELWEKGDK